MSVGGVIFLENLYAIPLTARRKEITCPNIEMYGFVEGC